MKLYPPELLDPPTGCANATLILRDRAGDEFPEAGNAFVAWLAAYEVPPAIAKFVAASVMARGCPMSGHAAQRLAAAEKALREAYIEWRMESFTDAEVLEAGE